MMTGTDSTRRCQNGVHRTGRCPNCNERIAPPNPKPTDLLGQLNEIAEQVRAVLPNRLADGKDALINRLLQEERERISTLLLEQVDLYPDDIFISDAGKAFRHAYTRAAELALTPPDQEDE